MVGKKVPLFFPKLKQKWLFRFYKCVKITEFSDLNEIFSSYLLTNELYTELWVILLENLWKYFLTLVSPAFSISLVYLLIGG